MASSAANDQQVSDPRSTNLGLSPPLDVVFWKRLTSEIADNEIFHWNSETLANGTWRTEIYVYVSGAQLDDPSFTERGGIITIVIVNDGFWKANNPNFGYNAFVHNINCDTASISKKQLPSTNSGVQVNKNWQYNVSYREALSMFQDGQPFQFEAVYENDFTLPETTQDGDETSDGVTFILKTQNALPNGTVFPINGVSVFRFNDVKVFPIKFEFQMNMDIFSQTVSRTLKVDLDFPGL